MTSAVVAGIPGWVLVAPAVAIWCLAVLDVVTDATLSADARLLWLVFMLVAAPLAPVRFLLRRRVATRPATVSSPARHRYLDAVEARELPSVG